MPYLSLADAKAIIAATLSRAGELGLTRPLSVAVLDAGGHLIAFERQDRSSMLRFEIAFGKAYGALAVGAGSRDVAKMAVERPNLALGLSGVSGGRIVPVPGGVLIRSGGDVIGAVGVTGDTSDNDENCASTGVERSGFQAER